MKTFFAAAAFASAIPLIALAQAPATSPPDQMVQDVNSDWGVMEIAKGHLLKDLQALVTDRDDLKKKLKEANDEIAKLKQEKAPPAPK